MEPKVALYFLEHPFLATQLIEGFDQVEGKIKGCINNLRSVIMDGILGTNRPENILPFNDPKVYDELSVQFAYSVYNRVYYTMRKLVEEGILRPNGTNAIDLTDDIEGTRGKLEKSLT